MRASSLALVCASVLIVVGLGPQVAFAQEEGTESWEQVPPQEAGETGVVPDKAQSDVAPPPPAAAPNWWFGLYVQDALVPAAMLKLFLDEAPTVGNIGVGLTATHRDKDGFSIVMGLGFQGYGFDGPFRISGDPEQDTEFLQSTLGFLHLRGEMLWSTEIVPKLLSFEYGIGIDVGLVLGDMRRSEAYRDTSGAYQPCIAKGTPNPLYCEFPNNPLSATDDYNAHGAHYNVVEKRVPPVALIPMLPVLALRLTPIEKLAIKLDVAFGLLQFSVGLSAAYGFAL